MTPLVSVIIPVYNAERYISQAFKSLLTQTIGFENLEVLLADDCSTDLSAEIIDGYAARYENVAALHMPENSGSASGPRNLCIEAVSSPFIVFLDNDDMLPKNACKLLYDNIVKTGADIAGGYYSELRGRALVDCKDRYSETPIGISDISESALCWFPAADPFWTKIFRTEIIRDNRLRFEKVYGEDSLFIGCYLACCKSASLIPEQTYIYRIREDSLFHVFNKDHFIDVTRCYDLMYGELSKKGKTDYFDSFLRLGVDSYMDLLADADSISSDEAAEVLVAWSHLLEYAGERGYEQKWAVSKILVDDMKSGNFEKAVFHLNAIRELYALRKGQMQAILGSKLWRLATKINALLGR